MVQLYNVDSPINREQRNNINNTFSDIQNRLSQLRFQISILAGGADLEDIINRIEETITNANNTTANTQQVLDNITAALGQLQMALNNNDVAIQNAESVTADARTEITNLQTEINNLQNRIGQVGNARTYDNATTYQLNNVVEYNGSSYMAIQETTGNLPPTLPLKRNDYWQLLAQRGVDGAGSVSSVNSQSPDINGNVLLDVVSNQDFQNHLDSTVTNIVNVVTAFGADPTGAADSTTAIQNAANLAVQRFPITDTSFYGNAVLYFPAGVYRLTERITMGGSPLTIKGEGQGVTTLIWDDSATSAGIEWTGVARTQDFYRYSPLTVKDLTLFATSGTTIVGSVGLSASFSFQPGEVVPSLYTDRLHIRGAFEKGIYVSEGSNSRINNTLIEGVFSPDGNYGMTEGIHFFTENSASDFIVSNSSIYSAKDGVRFSGGSDTSLGGEGATILGCHIVAVQRGVVYDHVVEESLLQVLNTHIACTRKAVYARINGLLVDGLNCLRRTEELVTWYGVDISGGRDHKVVNSTFSGLAERSETIAIRTNGNGGIFENNDFWSVNIGVEMLSGANRYYVDGNSAINVNILIAFRAGSERNTLGDRYSFSNVTSKLLNETGEANTIVYKQYSNSVIVTLNGGSVSEVANFTIPSGIFENKPRSGFLMVSGGSQLLGYYDFDSAASTANSASFLISKSNGTNIGSGTYRFSLALFE